MTNNTIYKIRRRSDGKYLATSGGFTTGQGRVYKRKSDLHASLHMFSDGALDGCEIVEFIIEENDVLDVAKYVEVLRMERAAAKLAKLRAYQDERMRAQRELELEELQRLREKYPNA